MCGSAQRLCTFASGRTSARSCTPWFNASKTCWREANRAWCPRARVLRRHAHVHSHINKNDLSSPAGGFVVVQRLGLLFRPSSCPLDSRQRFHSEGLPVRVEAKTGKPASRCWKTKHITHHRRANLAPPGKLSLVTWRSSEKACSRDALLNSSNCSHPPASVCHHHECSDIGRVPACLSEVG